MLYETSRDAWPIVVAACEQQRSLSSTRAHPIPPQPRPRRRRGHALIFVASLPPLDTGGSAGDRGGWLHLSVNFDSRAGRARPRLIVLADRALERRRGSAGSANLIVISAGSRSAFALESGPNHQINSRRQQRCRDGDLDRTGGVRLQRGIEIAYVASDVPDPQARPPGSARL